MTPVPLPDVARAVLAARRGGPPVAVVMRTEPLPPARVLIHADGRRTGSLGDPALDRATESLGGELLAAAGASGLTRSLDDDAGTVLYAEAHRPVSRLFVVGAGHIAVPLVRVGALLGLEVVVLDDRTGFATEERFPDAARVRPFDFQRPFADEAPGPADPVVLVTRAHRYDYDCLRALLELEPGPRYIGMVGSQRRVRAAFRALLDAGTDRDRLRSIHAPIGVSIGAETPEEIALSIAAELVAVRRGVVAAGSLRDEAAVVERWL